MSRATEVAEREALEAETETETEPDEAEAEEAAEQEREAEVEPEPEPEPSSLAVIADQEKQLDQESKRHAKALAKALGDHWGEFALCPLCQVDGYAMPYSPGEVGPEQREAVMTVLGESGLARFKEHTSEIRCSECDGWGEMLNGSRRPEQATSACQICMGTGHVAKPVAQAPQSNGYAAPAWTPPPPAFDPSMVNRDGYGRPLGHPDYGLDPAAVVGMVQT